MLLLLTLMLLVTRCVTAEDCRMKTSCDSCMGQPSCVWCADPKLYKDKCMDISDASYKCSPEDIIDLQSSVEIIDEKPLTTESENNQFVQISPQKVLANIRPSRSVTVDFQVAHAKQFPIDLYFLMDLSYSMRQSRNNLAKLGGKIMEAIKEKTENLATGFGSFVEKNVQPFTSGIPTYNCNPETFGENCTQPYSFFHKSSLADISEDEFAKAVRESPIAGNVDDPEGSLDALMQVMVCGERLGWRQDSRKIIILSTDRDYHFAGDGKLGGIFTPNDGQCHLNNTGDGSGYYTLGETLDYPSVSHINSVAQKNNFLIIFAVIEQYKEAYKALSERITGSYVDVLTADGANIINIVQNIYEDIVSSIKVMSQSSPDVNVTFSTFCEGGIGLGDDSCADIPLGSPVKFSAEISVEKCLDAPQTVNIFPIGLNENLTIIVETLCECDCTPVGFGKSPECSDHGFLTTCGVCDCDQDFSGPNCGCSGQTGAGAGEENCIDDGRVCGGQGDCVCGECQCDSSDMGLISGPYCECMDWTCPKFDELLCGGNGKCDCGVCQCDAGWEGEACSCTTEVDLCISPYDGDVCSDNGVCKCGKCSCNTGDDGQLLWLGKFCEKTPSDGSCSEVEDCVKCLAFKDATEDCRNCNFELEFIEDDFLREKNFTFDSTCERNKDLDCKYKYSVNLNESGNVWAVLHTFDGEKLRCKLYTLSISLASIGTVLIGGIIALICWKCCAEIHDRQQYAEFKREVENMKSGVNQNASELYKSPITKFENPMFGKG